MKKTIKKITLISSLLILGLTGCASQNINKEDPIEKSVSKITNLSVKEAATSYVKNYTNSIETAVTNKKYNNELAYKHINAEVCLKERGERYNEQISDNDKKNMIISVVGEEKYKKYQEISFGYYLRAHSFESLACEAAGLKIDPKDKFNFKIN